MAWKSTTSSLRVGSFSPLHGSPFRRLVIVLSVELVCLASAVPGCAKSVGAGVLLLIASLIFQEFPDFIVVVVHTCWWYWGTSAKITDHMSEPVSRSRVS